MKFSWKIFFAAAVAFFAFFPLTDTDSWWHLASARDFLKNGLAKTDPFCWTPSKTPWINVHLFFQLVAFGIFSKWGALGLVVSKSFLWGFVAFLWVLPIKRRVNFLEFSLMLSFAFLFRYAFECRPVLMSLLFLGIFWNLLPLLKGKFSATWLLASGTLLCVEWVWTRSQGLFPLGFAISFLAVAFFWRRISFAGKIRCAGFLALLVSVPLLHHQGVLLWKYPFGLLDRLVGGSASSQIFAQEIAENRAPTTLLIQGENVTAMLALIVAVVIAAAVLLRHRRITTRFRSAYLVVAAFLAVSAERNAVLFFFPFAAVVFSRPVFSLFLRRLSLRYFAISKRKFLSAAQMVSVLIFAFVLGMAFRNISAFFADGRFVPVSAERVPEQALIYLKTNPLLNDVRLFNDDRSGGYLEWNFPEEKTFADGRFILKDSLFMATYLGYAKEPETFLRSADSLQIGRALLPISSIALWKNLALALDSHPAWRIAYADSFYVVFDKNSLDSTAKSPRK